MGLIVRYFSLVAATVFLMNLAPQGRFAWAGVPEELLQETKKLAKLEKEFFENRLHNRWEALYAQQHPRYKEAVSFEEYKFFEGRVAYNYRKEGEAHMSGLLTPPLSYIKTNPPKKDALGFPIPRHYRWYVNPFIIVKDYIQDTISISKDGKHAMVKVTLTGRERLNPALIRDNFEFDFKRSHIDFWEKVDGRWVIAVLVNPASISGGKVFYLIPNNNDAWNKMEFVDIKPSDISVPSDES